MDINRVDIDILNAKDRIENRKNFKDLCDTCNQKACRDCNGRNKYVQSN